MNFFEMIFVPDSTDHIIKSFPLLLETIVLLLGESFPTNIYSSCPLNTLICFPLRVHSLSVVSLEPVKIN